MAGYKLSESAVKKVKRTVNNVKTTPLRKTPRQSSRISRAGGVTAGVNPTVRPAIITGGGAGAYALDLLDDEGAFVEASEGIATIATAYDLATQTSVVAYKVAISTLGAN